MNILVTGAKGFIGRNLVSELKNRGYQDIFEYDQDTTPDQLERYVKSCDFVFHLAGVNRPDKESEFMEGNYGFTSTLLNLLKENHNQSPILATSSIQALLDNPYGRSKKAGEELLLNYKMETGVNTFLYRLQNVFGKWCRPNYNSVVATFCNNIANDLPITINDREHLMSLVYIDDVIDTFLSAMEGHEKCANDGYYYVMTVYPRTVGELADLILSFKESRKNLLVPDMQDDFTRKLYSTYLTFLPDDQFSYPLKMNVDQRGSFTEFVKTLNNGQVSVNVSKPGIVKGNHWHQTKNEKFLVVNGEGVIRLRKIYDDAIFEYKVNGDQLTVIDIPPGYTHNIENLGGTDMVTIMWANEAYDPEKPDTYYLEV